MVCHDARMCSDYRICLFRAGAEAEPPRQIVSVFVGGAKRDKDSVQS